MAGSRLSAVSGGWNEHVPFGKLMAFEKLMATPPLLSFIEHFTEVVLKLRVRPLLGVAVHVAWLRFPPFDLLVVESTN